MKGYSFSREDVDARSLANQYAQSLGQIFTHEMKPMEVEILVAEIGYAADGSGDQLFHILYDGTVIDEDISVVLGGETEAIAERLGTFEQPPPSRMGFARPSLRSPGRNARSRQARSRSPCWNGATIAERSDGSTTPRSPNCSPEAQPGWRSLPSADAIDQPLTPTAPRLRMTLSWRRAATDLRYRERIRRHLHPARPTAIESDEVARYLFRRVVSWGRSSNVFLANGARLYLDVGSHPEYATPECDSVRELVVHDKAGERILEQLLTVPSSASATKACTATSTCSRTTPTPPGTATAATRTTARAAATIFVVHRGAHPFLVSRQIYAGAGKVLQTARARDIASASEPSTSGRASAQRPRSRPIINTRDEPHADAERYRRLHVIVGDSNMSEYTTFLKVARARSCCACSKSPRSCSAT